MEEGIFIAITFEWRVNFDLVFFFRVCVVSKQVIGFDFKTRFFQGVRLCNKKIFILPPHQGKQNFERGNSISTTDET